jgi:hypothetical protein
MIQLPSPRLSTNLPAAVDFVFIRRQAFEAQGTADVDLVRRDADLSAWIITRLFIIAADIGITNIVYGTLLAL